MQCKWIEMREDNHEEMDPFPFLTTECMIKASGLLTLTWVDRKKAVT